MTRGVVMRYVSARGARASVTGRLALCARRGERWRGEARLFRTGVAIPSSTPVEVREPTYQFGKRASRTERRFQLASPQTGVATVEILFHDRTRAQEVLAALREAWFEIGAAGAGPQS